MDFVVDHFERDPPVARHRDAPRPGPVADKLMKMPTGRTPNSLDTLGTLQGGKNPADPAYQITADLALVVVLDQAFETSMAGTSKPHGWLYCITVRSSSKNGIGPIRRTEWARSRSGPAGSGMGGGDGRLVHRLQDPARQVDQRLRRSAQRACGVPVQRHLRRPGLPDRRPDRPDAVVSAARAGRADRGARLCAAPLDRARADRRGLRCC